MTRATKTTSKKNGNGVHPAVILNGGMHQHAGRYSSEDRRGRIQQAERVRDGLENHPELPRIKLTLSALEDEALVDRVLDLGLDPQLYSRAGMIEFGARRIVYEWMLGGE